MSNEDDIRNRWQSEGPNMSESEMGEWLGHPIDPPHFITRREAEDKVRRHWQPAVEACQAVNAPWPVVDYRRARNYEIEEELRRIFGGTWVVSEWCPFKGWSLSRWQDHCPREAFDVVLEVHQRLVNAGERHPAVLADIRCKIAERWPADGGPER